MSEPAELDPFGAEWDRPRWTNRLTWVLVAAVVAALAFAGGLLIERQYDTTLLTTARGTARPAGGGLAVAGLGGGRSGRQAERRTPPAPAQAAPVAQRPRARAAPPAAPAEAQAAAAVPTGRAERMALARSGAPGSDGGDGAGAGTRSGRWASADRRRHRRLRQRRPADAHQLRREDRHGHRAPERDGHDDLRARGPQARRPGLGDRRRQPRRLRHRHLDHQPNDRRMTRRGRTGR